MPSRCNRVLVVLAAWLASGCGADHNPECAHSFLRYDNFGAPFMANWCRSCHSAGLPADMRQQAPADVNFDTLGEIRRWSLAIERSTAERTTMPPAGGPALAERE